MQSRKGSLKEAVINTLVGFVITYIFGYPIYWLNGVEMHHSTIFSVTICFTILSIARGYIIRRYFNSKERGISRTYNDGNVLTDDELKLFYKGKCPDCNSGMYEGPLTNWYCSGCTSKFNNLLIRVDRINDSSLKQK